MPAKNIRKEFIPDMYYHLYNRGVEKRKIYMDQQDYRVFLSYLKEYLSPKDIQGLQMKLADPQTGLQEKDRILKQLRMNNFCDSLNVLSYCLMPNHFHLLVKQREADIIDRFMNSLFTRYAMYFNRKYKRVGKLFQGIYRAVPVRTDEQLLHLSRYIHCNPLPILQGTALQDYSYSSYRNYLGTRSTKWISTEQILSFFSTKGFASYAAFVEDVSLQDASIERTIDVLLDLED